MDNELILSALIIGNTVGSSPADKVEIDRLYRHLKDAAKAAIGADLLESLDNSPTDPRSLRQVTEAVAMLQPDSLLELQMAAHAVIALVKKADPSAFARASIDIDGLEARNLSVLNSGPIRGKTWHVAETARFEGVGNGSSQGHAALRGTGDLAIGALHVGRDFVYHLAVGSFRQLPVWARAGSIFLLFVGLFGLAAFGVYKFDDFYRIRNKFDHLYKEQMQNTNVDFQVSSNDLLSLPKAIHQSNSPGDWANVSDRLKKRISVIEKFYAPLAACITDDTCWPRDERDEFCRVAATQALSVEEIQRRLGLVRGVNIVKPGGEDIFNGAFGPAVDLMSSVGLEAISKGPCAAELASQDRAQRQSDLPAAQAAWPKIVGRSNPLEMRDFPIDYRAADQVISDDNFEAAIRSAGEKVQKDIEARLCAQEQEMVAGSVDFPKDDESEFSQYYLSPSCRLEVDGSRKCTWRDFNKNTRRLVTGLTYESDEDQQIEFLREMFKNCQVNDWTPGKSGSFGGQNDWGYPCKEFIQQYERANPARKLNIDLISCFDYGALKVGSPE